MATLKSSEASRCREGLSINAPGAIAALGCSAKYYAWQKSGNPCKKAW
jgi:hypothetical protein